MSTDKEFSSTNGHEPDCIGEQPVGDVFTRLYDELRKLASSYVRREPEGNTLHTTALVHEAFVRLAGQDSVGWQDRRGFFSAAATAMRRLLVDHARARKAEKRGFSMTRQPLGDVVSQFENNAIDLVGLDQALTRLASKSERMAKIVELRFFVGLSVEETAELLGVSERTVAREWTIARSWLFGEMEDSE